ncbi:NADH dehydrogenase [Raoultella terrigena]|nr:NADH dehydrogenase [Raoultella terrigena]
MRPVSVFCRRCRRVFSGAAHSELTKLGVRVLTKTMVTSADANGLHTKDGEFIKADLMVWAAGIKAPDFMKEIGGLETNRINQLVVEPTAANDPRCGYLRHRRLRFLRPSGRRIRAAARAGRSPDGNLRAA